MTEAITLTSGDYSARILPQVGSGLGRLQWRGRDLVQAYPQELENAPNPEFLGSFPMLPFAGRVRDCQFDWRGESHEVRAHPVQPHGLHGDGWINGWDVEAVSETVTTLTLSCRDEPLAFAARLTYALSSEGLTLTTSLTNLGAKPLPFGFGHHPWFPREEGAQMQFGASHFWLEAPEGFPGQRISLPPELDASQGGDLPLTWRNNCYEGWDGLATISYPESGHAVLLSASKPIDWLMIYANPDVDFVCLEPQSHLPAAHNMPGEGERFGLVELVPGRALYGTMTIAARAL